MYISNMVGWHIEKVHVLHIFNRFILKLDIIVGANRLITIQLL